MRKKFRLHVARTVQTFLTEPFKLFMQASASGGNLLILALIIGMLWANSNFSQQYHAVWDNTVFGVYLNGLVLEKNLHHWLNDGLMAIFFFLIGLEIKREMLVGELSVFRKALSPVAAAIGGMLMPAVFFIFLQNGNPETIRGWAIPTATDIAFALGVLSLLGSRVPLSMKIFLTALAIVDDIGAILLIGLFYSAPPVWGWLFVGLLILSVMLLLNRAGVRNLFVYILLSVLLWGAILFSGVHATLAGVIAAFAIPVKSSLSRKRAAVKGDHLTRQLQELSVSEQRVLADPAYNRVLLQLSRLYSEAGTPLQRLEHALHPVTAFLILPLFALANGGVTIRPELLVDIVEPVSLGIIVGLTFGKPVGIVSMCWLLEKLRIVERPAGLSWREMWAGGFFAGIGFTMSIFIANLAFADALLLESAKLAILIGSLLSTIIGIGLLFTNKNEKDISSK